MDKRSQVSALLFKTRAQLRSVEVNYTMTNDNAKALAALDASVEMLMQVWELIKIDDDHRLKKLFDILADEQSFKKDE